MYCSQNELLKRIEQSRARLEPDKHEVRLNDSHEPLATQSSIEAAGIACRPFWHDEINIEGEAYTEYIQAHPNFDLSVRQTVLDNLVAAQSLLPANWQLVLKAGYRPYEVQVKLLQDVIDDAMRRHPQWSPAQCIEHARTYISDPSIKVPPHTTGGAVDVDVIDRETNLPIDFGCPPNTTDEISFLHSKAIPASAQQNRHTLLRAMLSVEFAPLFTEWWHFQYGETYWAAFYDQQIAQYDIIR